MKESATTKAALPERLESDHIAWTNTFYIAGHSDDLREVAIEAARRYNAHEQMVRLLEQIAKRGLSLRKLALSSPNSKGPHDY